VAISLQGKVSPQFLTKFRNRFEQYGFEAGVLNPSKPHYQARPIHTKTGKRKKAAAAFTTIDGMRARKKTRTKSGTVGLIAGVQSKRVNFIVAPFRRASSPELTKLRKAWIKFSKSDRPMSLRKQLEDALVNVILVPIRKRRYGPNTKRTVAIKGFNRRLFDTGQLWQSIKAKVTKLPKGKKVKVTG
jgi:hypothetical protein